MKILKILLFPISLIMIFLIYIYKYCISPFIGSNCKYIPTCSTYGLQAFKKYDAINAAILTLKRILKCNPKQNGCYEFIPPNIRGDYKWVC